MVCLVVFFLFVVHMATAAAEVHGCVGRGHGQHPKRMLQAGRAMPCAGLATAVATSPASLQGQRALGMVAVTSFGLQQWKRMMPAIKHQEMHLV